MRHTIEGKVFCITGTLTHYTRATAEAAIMGAGGDISRTVSKKTDFLVCGAGASGKLDKARSRGIPVIAEADLEAFLSGDVVEVDEEVVVSGDASVRDLVGEARAALDGHPDSAMWSALVAIVDSCAPEQLGSLVDFLEPQVARWEVEPDARWQPDATSVSCEGAPAKWLKSAARGELRVAPFRWIVEMATGNPSPKHRLARAIHVHDMEMNGTSLIKVLSSPELTNLRVLDVDESKLSVTFWKKLRTLPSTTTLERLRISRVTVKTMKGYAGDHHLHELEHLSLYSCYHMEEEAVAELFAADMMRGLKALTVENFWPDKILSRLDDPALLPDLERVTLDTYSDGYVRDGLGCAVCARVPEVAVRIGFDTNKTGAKALSRVLGTSLARMTRGADGPQVLDLSGVHAATRDDRKGWDHDTVWVAALEGWAPPRNTNRVRLGPNWSEATALSLQTLGVEPLK